MQKQRSPDPVHGPEDGNWPVTMFSVFFRQGCASCQGRHKEWPKVEWLETIDMPSFTVLEAGRMNSRCHQGSFFPELLFWVSFPVSGGNWPFLASLGSWTASVSISEVISSVSISNPPRPFIRTVVIEFRAQSNPGWSHLEILNSLTSFPNLATFTGARLWGYFGEGTIQPAIISFCWSCISPTLLYLEKSFKSLSGITFSMKPCLNCIIR